MNNRGWNRNRGGRRGRPDRGSGRGNRGWGGNRRGRGNFGTSNQNYQQWENRPARETPGIRLVEENIGVTEYMTDHKGFNGIIKLRYADFQVSEVNENGQVAQLTDLKPPEPPAEKEVNDDEDLLLHKYNLEILPMETWDKINSLSVTPSEACTEVVEIDVSDVSKENRTKIHEAVKKAFGPSIIGSTVNTDEKKFIRFERYKKGKVIDRRVKWVWPEDHVYFILYKENVDTMEAAVKIAERLRLNIKPTMIGYAGTKDRRAKTAQWFSLRKVDPRKIASSCKGMREITVGNYSFHKKQVKLGMLQGNLFRIALRNVEESDEIVDSACMNLKERGFINYYGLQRFGSRVEVPTWDIGKKLLQSNYREVIESILSERPGPLEKVLQAYAQSGPIAAMHMLPYHAMHHPEVRLLRALANNSNDLLSAIEQIPRNTRLLYVHAYQSYVFNRAVTERIKKHGLKPAVGDLVFANRKPGGTYEKETFIDESGFETQQDNEECRDEDDDQNGDQNDDQNDEHDQNDECDQNVENETQEGTENNEENIEQNKDSNQLKDKKKKNKKSSKKLKKKVKVLTQEDVDSDELTIFDIVMPLPGYDVEYPPNMKEFYEEMLKTDGLTLDMKHNIKSYNMQGAYRRLAILPGDVEWQCVKYTDPHTDLIASDLDKLQGKEQLGIEADGKFKAVLLTMTLPASCYATMALRELMKVDTSSMTQAMQNNYHKSDSTKRPAESTDDDVKKAKLE